MSRDVQPEAGRIGRGGGHGVIELVPRDFGKWLRFGNVSELHHHLLPPGSLMSHEQAVHDRINLYRLVRRLEKSIAEEGWRNPGDLKDPEPFPHAVWIRTQGTLGVSPPHLYLLVVSVSTGVSDFVVVSCLQKIKHAKSLLKNVELENQLQFV